MSRRRKQKKIQEFTCRYTRNVYYVGWSQWNGSKCLKKNLEDMPKKKEIEEIP